MTNKLALRLSAIMGFLGVALGAFGAHRLHDVLAQHGTVAIWQTAVLYHLIHAVMLFLIAGRPQLSVGAWWSFFIGILIFSGSLYVLAVTNIRWLGAITPVGGLSFLVGWLWLVVAPESRH